MASLELLGAAGGEVTGSGNLLSLRSGKKVLVDYGAFQGHGNQDARNQSQDNTDFSELAGVFITHAHADHIGRLPFLAHPQIPEVPIYMTGPTLEIGKIALNNAKKLSPRLYPPGSVKEVLSRVQVLPYDSQVEIGGAKVTLKDAGHILGSASVAVKDSDGQTYVFSGDIGNPHSSILRPATPIDSADIITMESTYGDRSHSDEDMEEVIFEFIDGLKGPGLIAAFSIDRTQKIIDIFKTLSERGVRVPPVILDSPMASAVTEVYRSNPRLLSPRIQEQKHPLKFKELIDTDNKNVKKSRLPKHGPRVIIAGSGMMNGGRIVGHAARELPDKKTRIMLAGFAAAGTPSRRLLEGKNQFDFMEKIYLLKLLYSKQED